MTKALMAAMTLTGLAGLFGPTMARAQVSMPRTCPGPIPGKATASVHGLAELANGNLQFDAGGTTPAPVEPVQAAKEPMAVPAGFKTAVDRVVREGSKDLLSLDPTMGARDIRLLMRGRSEDSAVQARMLVHMCAGPDGEDVPSGFVLDWSEQRDAKSETANARRQETTTRRLSFTSSPDGRVRDTEGWVESVTKEESWAEVPVDERARTEYRRLAERICVHSNAPPNCSVADVILKKTPMYRARSDGRFAKAIAAFDWSAAVVGILEEGRGFISEELVLEETKSIGFTTPSEEECLRGYEAIEYTASLDGRLKKVAHRKAECAESIRTIRLEDGRQALFEELLEKAVVLEKE